MSVEVAASTAPLCRLSQRGRSRLPRGRRCSCRGRSCLRRGLPRVGSRCRLLSRTDQAGEVVLLPGKTSTPLRPPSCQLPLPLARPRRPEGWWRSCQGKRAPPPRPPSRRLLPALARSRRPGRKVVRVSNQRGWDRGGEAPEFIGTTRWSGPFGTGVRRLD